jgi:hypothetical protein
MIIEIYGKPRKLTNYDLIHSANFFAEELMPKKLADNIFLEIHLKYGLNAAGYCYPQLDNVRPKDFVIELQNNMSFKTTLTVLAHEMVHVKQYAKGELFEYVKNRKVRWNNPKLEPFVAGYGLFSEKELDYYDQPWEIEANGRERGLFRKYQEFLASER